MAKEKEKRSKGPEKAVPEANRLKAGLQAIQRFSRRLLRAVCYAVGVLVLAVTAAIALFTFVNPPVTPLVVIEFVRLGSVDREWVPIESVPDHFPRSLVAAEDANFCLHWGFDLDAIRSAAEAGYNRGASSISQQTAKNLFLWPGRSWIRKVLEVPLTILIEAIWTKRRILEVYMNIIEFDSGVFGVAEAARQHFGKEPNDLTEGDSARLAVVVPNPRNWNPFDLSTELENRVARIQDGAKTILRDSRSSCFDV